MEPSVWVDLFQKSGPVFAYILGVLITVRLKLYDDLKPETVYLMALPVGCVKVGILISGSSVTLDNITHYGYTQSIEAYLTFCGVIMFYGILAPEMFAFYRKFYRKKL